MASDVGTDAVWQGILRRVLRIGSAHTKVGILGDGENATIGLSHEYGTKTIPQRSWLRSTFEDKRDQLVRLQASAARGIVSGRIDTMRAMGLIGAWGAGAVKSQITRDATFTPLAPSTLARRAKGPDGSGSKQARPLIDTGQMVGSITFVVVP